MLRYGLERPATTLTCLVVDRFRMTDWRYLFGVVRKSIRGVLLDSQLSSPGSGGNNESCFSTALSYENE